MDNKKLKDILVQLFTGIIAVVFGVISVGYGFGYLTGKINGNIRTCLLLAITCITLFLICCALTASNYKKYGKSNHKDRQ